MTDRATAADMAAALELVRQPPRDTRPPGSDPEPPGGSILPPPSDPMAVAREVAADLYTADERLVLRCHRGDWYSYDGAAWPEIDARAIRARLYDYLEHARYEKESKGLVTEEPWAPNRRKVDDVLDALRAVTFLAAGDPPMWTRNATRRPPAAEMVAMANGLLHVPTRELLAHTPNLFTHHALPFEYDPDAPAPGTWLTFLEQLWEDDPTSIDALQEVFGYIIAGDTRQQKIVMLVGPRRAGKGTIGRVLTGILGPHNVAAPTMASLGTNFGLQPLIGRPLALVSDARLSGRSDGNVVVERLLSVSGEDSLTIDRKYRDPWTGRLPTRFVILTNELPKLSDSSGALASRFVVFVLTRSFLGREDPLLTDKLLAEAPGILNWALDGFDRLAERGHFVTPASGRDAVQELEDLSSPVSAFVRDECEIGADCTVPVDRLWTAWKAWCERENRHPGTKAVLGRNLKATAPMVKKRRERDGDDRTHIYAGIGLQRETHGRPL